MPRRRHAFILLTAIAVAGCSSAGPASDATTPVTICNARGTEQSSADLPAIARIPEAIAALEAKLGGAQEYFEVNATARVVNLFVALDGGTLAQAWLYADGTLTPKDPQKASGGTFTRAELEFHPDKVFATVRAQIPEAILESFYVNGDGKGNVQYGLLTSAVCGGGLDIVVGADGSVKSVDPVQ